MSARAGSDYSLSLEKPDAPLLEGCVSVDSMGVDPRVHVTDAVEIESADVNIVLPPSFTVVVVLEGPLDATLDDIALRSSATHGPQGHFWYHRRPTRLHRRLSSGTRVRKVNVSIPPSAVADMLRLEEDTGPPGFLEDDSLVVQNWTPSRRAIRLAEGIIEAANERPALYRLSMGISALTLLHDALSQFVVTRRPLSDVAVGSRDAARAYRVRNYLLANLRNDIELARIARDTGMSVSTLQRVFKRTFGRTVFEFVRERRLELARISLRCGEVTVGEAAYLAGYNSASNFSTAFRQAFGYPPSHCVDEIII